MGIKLLYYSLGINESGQFKDWLSDVLDQILVPLKWRRFYQSAIEEAIDIEKEKELSQNDSILFSSRDYSGASSKIQNLSKLFFPLFIPS